jgi:hypothetical protein
MGAANALNLYANNFAPGIETRSLLKQARDNSEEAIALAPEHGARMYAQVSKRGYLLFPAPKANMTASVRSGSTQAR